MRRSPTLLRSRPRLTELLGHACTAFTVVGVAFYCTLLFAAALPPVSSCERVADWQPCGKAFHDRLPGIPAHLFGAK